MFTLLFLATNVYAQAATAPKGAMGILNMLMPFVLIIVIFYFLMIRPQQKQRKQHQQFLAGLKKGDEVLTSSGIVGTIYSVSDKLVTLELEGDVKIKMLKGMITANAKDLVKE
jgi:preprotein translocase subunit YajC